jgi:hypothetical protein
MFRNPIAMVAKTLSVTGQIQRIGQGLRRCATGHDGREIKN